MGRDYTEILLQSRNLSGEDETAMALYKPQNCYATAY